MGGEGEEGGASFAAGSGVALHAINARQTIATLQRTHHAGQGGAERQSGSGWRPLLASQTFDEFTYSPCSDPGEDERHWVTLSGGARGTG